MHAEGSESIGKQISAPVGFSNNIPNWLDMLFKEKFFDPCLAHHEYKRNDRNIFCLDCCISFCSNCSENHLNHQILQIRKHSCYEVVKTEDMDKLINCSLVQSFNLNRAYVVYLREHPNKKKENTAEERNEVEADPSNNKKKTKRGHSEKFRTCSSCPYSLREENEYCSIICKVKQLLRTEGSIARHLRYNALRARPVNQETAEEFSADPILRASTSTNSSGSKGNGIESVKFLKRKKKTGDTSSNSVGLHRRKGVPSRAPLF